MQFSLKTLLTAIIGTAAFENGLHIVCKKVEGSSLDFGWPVLLMGTGLLAVVWLDFMGQYRKLHNNKATRTG